MSKELEMHDKLADLIEQNLDVMCNDVILKIMVDNGINFYDRGYIRTILVSLKRIQDNPNIKEMYILLGNALRKDSLHGTI
jgi:hypothetical protein